MFPTAETAGVAPTESPVTAGGTEPVIEPTGLPATYVTLNTSVQVA